MTAPARRRATGPVVVEKPASSILVESKLPDTDCVINPYTGCAFGCAYCYASFMGRFVGEPIDEWGNYVYVKTNAVDLIRHELARLTPAKAQRSVLLSSVTDPYQGVESRYRLTRGILTEFAAYRYPGLVGILTKSPLVVRDIDVLGRLPRVEVGMTVTTTDDNIGRWLEVRAPIASRRLRALARLHESGIPTYAFVGPLLPHFAGNPGLLNQLFGALAATGVRDVYVEHINLKKYIRARLDPILTSEPADVRTAYVRARSDDHRERLEEIVDVAIAKHGLRLRLGAVLEHGADATAPVTITRSDPS